MHLVDFELIYVSRNVNQIQTKSGLPSKRQWATIC